MSKSVPNVNINKPSRQDNARTGKGKNTADQASRKDTSKRASAVRDSIINNNNSENSTIYADRGDDVINTDTLGSNTIKAGRGDDVVNVSVEMGSRTNPNGTLTINGGAGHDKVILSGKREDYQIDKQGNYVHIDTGSRIKINDDVEEVKFQKASTNNSATPTRTASSSTTTNTSNAASTTSRTNQGKINALQQGLDKYFDVLNTSAGEATMSLTSRLDKMGNELKKIGPIKMSYDDFVGANEGAFSPATYAARTDSLQQLNSDVLVDLENQMSAALAIDTDAGRQSVANLRTEINITKQEIKLNNGASELTNGLLNKVQIDFGNIGKEQAKSLYQINLENLVEAEVKYSQGIASNFEERRGVLPPITALGEMRTTQHVISELERQYGFKRKDLLPERALQAGFLVELNDDILADLKNQMSESLTIDSDAGRISSAALRTEINLVKKDKDFWSSRVDYWSGDDNSTPKSNFSNTNPVRAAQAEFFVELNNDILYDLNTQMSAALAIDTEAGRLSAASLRAEIATTKSLLDFWQSTATYWSGS
ncbi:MAG: hypothetical protein VKK32_00950 [Candidatus Melainabacteria bacterium]|nr:hypothetical protein [Candidatus Melainabacteria bacterium]